MSNHKKSADIIGKTVVNGDGFIIGEVSDYIIDVECWQITDLQVKIEKNTAKELGLKAPFFGSLIVLVDVDQVRSTTDQVIIHLSKDEFQPYVEARTQASKAKAKGKGKDKDKDKDEAHEEG